MSKLAQKFARHLPDSVAVMSWRMSMSMTAACWSWWTADHWPPAPRPLASPGPRLASPARPGLGRASAEVLQHVIQPPVPLRLSKRRLSRPIHAHRGHPLLWNGLNVWMISAMSHHFYSLHFLMQFWDKWYRCDACILCLSLYQIGEGGCYGVIPSELLFPRSLSLRLSGQSDRPGLAGLALVIAPLTRSLIEWAESGHEGVLRSISDH